MPGQPFPLVLGRGDPPLSPEGEAQARAVAERLAGEPLAALFVTPLQRTAQTAAPLAGRTGLEPQALEQLCETYLGEWEGGEFRIRVAEGDPLAMRLLAEERWDLIPGAESMEDLAARVRDGVGRIVEATGAGRVAAAVLHGGVIGEICRQATSSRPFAFIHSDNARSRGSSCSATGAGCCAASTTPRTWPSQSGRRSGPHLITGLRQSVDAGCSAAADQPSMKSPCAE